MAPQLHPRRTPPALAILLLLSAIPSGALEVVYVTRHAQKDQDPRWDSQPNQRPLSDKGVVCAGALARRLHGAGLAAVYSTTPERTRQTARIVAAGAARRPPTHASDRTAEPSADFAHRILERHRRDRAVLFVGHSNTVDDLVLAFRPDAEPCLAALGLAHPMIPETQYGGLWVVHLDRELVSCDGGVRWEEVASPSQEDCTTP